MDEQKRGGGGKKAAGVGAAAIIIALLFGMGNGFGLGGGSGMGTAEGTGTKSQAVTAESAAEESKAAESTSEESRASESVSSESAAGDAKPELVIRVHNMEIYVDETLCKTDEDILKAVEEKLKDGVTLILQDDYADNEAFTSVEKLLDKESYDYRTETKK